MNLNPSKLGSEACNPFWSSGEYFLRGISESIVENTCVADTDRLSCDPLFGLSHRPTNKMRLPALPVERVREISRTTKIFPSNPPPFNSNSETSLERLSKVTEKVFDSSPIVFLIRP